jgi:DNA-directed RNA polymerase beta' subunit
MRLLFLVGVICTALLLGAQDRDFLTPNEVEQIREAQEPNERLALYVHFAKQRIDLLEQYLASEKPGRSLFIHNTLEDYSHIIEAIDAVSDDALLHKKPIDKGLAQVLPAEKQFLAQLQKIEESQPKDLDLYKFVLDDAIQTTSDSRDLAMENAGKRTGELEANQEKEKKEREAMMPAQEVSDRKKQENAQQPEQKKVPSLYRPGEKPQNPQ